MTFGEKRLLESIPSLIERVEALEARLREIETKRRPGRPRKHADE